MWLGATAAGSVVRLRVDVGGTAAPRGSLRVERELTFVLRAPVSVPVSAPVVASGTSGGERLLARLDGAGMPSGLAEMGFANAGDLWPPWCAVLDGEAVVSVAFAARLSPTGAEVGVATVPQARGRGFAAAVTAAWSAHPALAGRALFYTAAAENASSLRVAERLALQLLGPTTSIS